MMWHVIFSQGRVDGGCSLMKTQLGRVLVVFELRRAGMEAVELDLVAEFPDIFRIVLCKLFIFAVSVDG